jgi:hypothetical protein
MDLTAFAINNYGNIVLGTPGVKVDLPDGSELKQGASNFATVGRRCMCGFLGKGNCWLR